VISSGRDVLRPSPPVLDRKAARKAAESASNRPARILRSRLGTLRPSNRPRSALRLDGTAKDTRLERRIAVMGGEEMKPTAVPDNNAGRLVIDLDDERLIVRHSRLCSLRAAPRRRPPMLGTCRPVTGGGSTNSAIDSDNKKGMA